MYKKTIVLMIVMALCLSFVPADASGEPEETVSGEEALVPVTEPVEEVPEESLPAEDGTADSTDGDISWVLDEEGTLTVSGTGAMPDYTQLSEVPWRDDRSAIQKVIVAPGVTSIGSFAFADLTNLTDVEMPAGITDIGSLAFWCCSSLKSITIPAGVTSIGERAFQGCGRLTGVTIPEGVESIGNYTFGDCIRLKSVSLPASMESIGQGAFYGCIALTLLTLEEGVTTIGKSAFYWCMSLTSVSIPNTVTIISNGAFEDCSGLTSITLPESITDIERGAFTGCTGLSSVYYSGTAEQWAQIAVAAYNDCLTGATVTCGHTHTYTESTTVSPTCTDAGYSTYTCSLCGATFTADIVEALAPDKGHTLTEVEEVPATCITAGHTAGSHCSVCGQIFEATEVLPATGHDYDSSEICTKCSHRKPQDMTGDGNVNAEELVYLVRCLSGEEPMPAPTLADINNDGEVDLLDLVVLMKELAYT